MGKHYIQLLLNKYCKRLQLLEASCFGLFPKLLKNLLL